MSNCEILIVDGRMRSMPLGIPGELSISGGGLVLGYIVHSENTRHSIIEIPRWDCTPLPQTRPDRLREQRE